MSSRGVGAGSGRSGKSFEQLEREVAELRRLVKELIQPKSRARVVNVGALVKLYVYEITTAYSAGDCVATIDELDGTEVETGATVTDPIGTFADAPTSAKGFCVKQNGSYYALGPYVTDIDWTSPNLTFKKGGGASIAIDTAEVCGSGGGVTPVP